jgi:hypothetical protein
MKVNGIFRERDNETDFQRIEVKDLKYVKRLTTQQAKSVSQSWKAFKPTSTSNEDTYYSD